MARKDSSAKIHLVAHTAWLRAHALDLILREGIASPSRLGRFQTRVNMWEEVDVDWFAQFKERIASTVYQIESGKRGIQFQLLERLAELYGWGASAGRSQEQTVAWFKLPIDEFASEYVASVKSRALRFAVERAELQNEPQRATLPDGPPYIGLATMRIEHADRYFGRSRKIQEDSTTLADPNGPSFFLVNGASGTGKSSYVLAGLLPQLLSEQIASGTLRSSWVEVRPAQLDETNPIASLAASVLQACDSPTSVSKLVREWGTQHLDIAADIRRRLPQLKYIVVDQLEEIFHDLQDPKMRQLFFQVLSNLVAHGGRGSPKIILTIRSDFRERCLDVPELSHALDNKHFRDLFPLNEEGLREIIFGPAERFGIDVSEVAEVLLNESVTHTGRDNALPLLAVTLNHLFRERSRNRLLLSKLGERGVAGVLDRLADETFESFLSQRGMGPEGAERLFAEIFGTLVSVTPAGEPTRRKSPIDAIESPLAKQLIERFAGPRCRLLVYDTTDDSERAVEVAHEVLFRSWQRLDKWIGRQRNRLRELELIEYFAEKWCERKHIGELSISHISSAHRAMIEIGRTPRSLSSASHAYLFPRDHLHARLLQDVATTSHQERALIGDAILLIERSWTGHSDRRPGVAPSDLIDADRTGVFWRPIKGETGSACLWIAKWPVTQTQFKAFVAADSGHANLRNWIDPECWIKPAEFRHNGDNQPVTELSWHEACAFCCWLNGIYQERGLIGENEEIRLPTEEEWLAAAGGQEVSAAEVREQFNGELPCNTYEANLKRMVAVGMYPNGFTPNGVMDLAGNVWEMCLNKFERPADITFDRSTGARAMRGGSWYEDFTLGRAIVSSRRGDDRSTSIGFRPVLAKTYSM